MEKVDTQVDVPKKSFRLQGKNFFLTYPKCNLTREVVLSILLEKLVDVKYVIVASELHKDGTPHIHALIMSNTKIHTRSNTFFDLTTFHGNYQAARDTDDVIEYIKKSDTTPLTHGVYKSPFMKQGESRSENARLQRLEINKKILDTPLPDLVLNGDISIYSYEALSKSKNRFIMDSQIIPKYMPKTCIWIYGQAGIGKSRYVRDNFGENIYLKPQNKWWDGYKQETVVLLDDFDLKGEHLSHYLKIWADCYSFNAEIKGGTCRPVYDKFFITSQYMPHEIFCQGNDFSKHDPEIVAAIRRRFMFMTVKDGVLVDLE